MKKQIEQKTYETQYLKDKKKKQEEKKEEERKAAEKEKAEFKIMINYYQDQSEIIDSQK